MNSPAQFHPTCASDFIGTARETAKVLIAKAARVKAGGSGSLKVLLHGSPGTGKTELARLLARNLAGHALCVEHLNGQSLVVDAIRDWRRNTVYRPIFGDRLVKLVDEIDAASPAALNELRTFLDNLPPCVDFIATTNRTLDDLQPQLQSRFQTFRFTPCEPGEVGDMLAKRFNIPPAVAYKIATANKGNVRASLLDAESFLDAMEAP